MLITLDLFCECNCLDSTGASHHLCLLVYYIPKGYVPVVLPHGNSKSNKPFFPTWSSTMKMIKTEAQHNHPKEVMASVTAKVGGVMSANAPGKLPRGERQIINTKCVLKFSNDEMDVLCSRQKQVIRMFVMSRLYRIRL